MKEGTVAQLQAELENEVDYCVESEGGFWLSAMVQTLTLLE